MGGFCDVSFIYNTGGGKIERFFFAYFIKVYFLLYFIKTTKNKKKLLYIIQVGDRRDA